MERIPGQFSISIIIRQLRVLCLPKMFVFGQEPCGYDTMMVERLKLLKNGYPPVFMKEVNRDEYLKRFELSDNDINPMLDFMADRLIESLEEKLKFMKERE